MLKASYDCDKPPTLNVTEDSEAVRLLRSGPGTWVIRHAFEILSTLVGLWAIVVLFTLVKARGGRNENECS